MAAVSEGAVDRLAAAAAAGDRRALARLLTRVERGGADGRAAAAAMHELGGAGTYTVGLTGAPGAGKSTLTDALVADRRARDERVAVVAIDPSSPYTGGAILGDRVRLREAHIADDGVFVRSLANRGQLGGLAAAIPDVVRAFDCAGWPLVLIETVGVGQTEVAVAGQADTTVVVVNPGWGDEVQANKAGLLEIADVLVVNKADRPGVSETVRELKRMLAFSGHRPWTPPVVETVAVEDTGIAELRSALEGHRAFLEREGGLAARRAARLRGELRERVVADTLQRLLALEREPEGRALLDALRDGRIDLVAATLRARSLLAPEPEQGA